jgi:rod shape determining protein RodA
MRLSHAIARFDWILLLSALALTSVGLVVMYGIGISRPDAGIFLFEKQAVAGAIGLVGVIAFVFFLDYRQLRGLGIPVYVAGALLLIAVLVFGHTIRGTRGWFEFGGLSFQPVEVAKICLVVALSSYLVRFTHGKLPWTALAGSAIAAFGYAGLVLAQPDFGSAAVIIIVWAVLVAFVGIPWRALATLALLGLVGGFVLWTFLFQPYQKDRFLAFFDPSRDTRGAAYNVTQARIAIGSGGFFGKGIGEGSQSRLRFLPEAATDFTFAVVGEELGFVGIAFVLGCFAVLFRRFAVIARNAEDDFAVLIAVGLGALLLIHVIVNAGMNLGVMPVTGIPIPFLSGASSFVIATYLGIALIESIAVHRRANG